MLQQLPGVSHPLVSNDPAPSNSKPKEMIPIDPTIPVKLEKEEERKSEGLPRHEINWKELDQAALEILLIPEEEEVSRQNMGFLAKTMQGLTFISKQKVEGEEKLICVKLCQRFQVENKIACIEGAYVALEGGEDLIRDARICKYLTEEGVVGSGRFVEFRNDPSARVLYLCTEFMGWTTLWHFMNTMEQKYDAWECYFKIIQMLRQVATTMKICHEKGVAHRDISLENIMVDERVSCIIPGHDITKMPSIPATTLIDWGIAFEKEANKSWKTCKGRVAKEKYIPLEMLLCSVRTLLLSLSFSLSFALSFALPFSPPCVLRLLPV